MSLFLALLAIVAEAAVVLAVVLWAGRVSRRLRELGRVVAQAVAPDALWLAGCVALIATAGSLYFSEVAHFRPCTLCWYQRVCMYPLVPVLTIAARRREPGTRSVAIVLAGAGLPISLYHIVLERFPTLESGACDPTNPCTLVWVRRFGYLTIPTMAASAFALIITLVFLARAAEDHVSPEEES